MIGTKGCNIEKIEKKLEISIDVRELKKEKNKIKFQLQEEKTHIRLFTEQNKDVEIFIDNEFLSSAISSKKGEIKINKQGDVGRALLSALSKNKAIEVRA